MYAPLIAAGFLFIALTSGLPYGYFQILRWVVCGASCYGAFLAMEKDLQGWMWTMAGMALLFNPILPIRLSRDLWQILDVIGGIVFLCAIPIFKGKTKEA
jgi:hypothetical protein